MFLHRGPFILIGSNGDPEDESGSKYVGRIRSTGTVVNKSLQKRVSGRKRLRSCALGPVILELKTPQAPPTHPRGVDQTLWSRYEPWSGPPAAACNFLSLSELPSNSSFLSATHQKELKFLGGYSTLQGQTESRGMSSIQENLQSPSFRIPPFKGRSWRFLPLQ